jgi:hypothetical protein
MIKDVAMRFIERVPPGGKMVRVLQWRKLVKVGPGNNWRWEWSDWSDVPLEVPSQTVTGRLHR